MLGLQFAVARSQSSFALLVFLGVPCIGRTSASTSLLRSSYKQCYAFPGSLSPIAMSLCSQLLDSCRVGSTIFQFASELDLTKRVTASAGNERTLGMSSSYIHMQEHIHELFNDKLKVIVKKYYLDKLGLIYQIS